MAWGSSQKAAPRAGQGGHSTGITPRGGLAPAPLPAAAPGGHRDPLAVARAVAAHAGPVSVGLQRGDAASAQLRLGKVSTGVGTRKHPVIDTNSSRASRDAPQAPDARRDPGQALGGRGGAKGRGQGAGGQGAGPGRVRGRGRACRPRPSRSGVSAGRRAGPPPSSAPIGCRAAGARVLTHPALPLAAGAEGAGRGRRSVSEGRGAA